jgi:hypothetical protein
MSLATLANRGSSLIWSATFLDLADFLGSADAFLVYAILGIVALAFIASMVPETKGAAWSRSRTRWKQARCRCRQLT